MKLKSLGLVLLSMAVATVCSAQTQDTSSKDSTSSKPQAAADKVPPKQDAQAAPEKKKPKKVWTNDEVVKLPGKVSVVGQPRNNEESWQGMEDYPSNDEDGDQNSQVESYREQIAQLQRQIEAADERIAQLKSFKGENSSPTGGINPSKGYNMVPIEDQIKQLEAKKKQLQGQIDDLENEARKNGIDPGKLR